MDVKHENVTQVVRVIFNKIRCNGLIGNNGSISTNSNILARPIRLSSTCRDIDSLDRTAYAIKKEHITYTIRVTRDELTVRRNERNKPTIIACMK